MTSKGQRGLGLENSRIIARYNSDIDIKVYLDHIRTNPTHTYTLSTPWLTINYRIYQCHIKICNTSLLDQEEWLHLHLNESSSF